MNKVMLVGRLGNDPQLGTTQSPTFRNRALTTRGARQLESHPLGGLILSGL